VRRFQAAVLDGFGMIESNGSGSFYFDLSCCLAESGEIRVLREHVGPRRLRFTDEQRRRLAAKAKKLRFGRLKEIANPVTSQTLLAWHLW